MCGLMLCELTGYTHVMACCKETVSLHLSLQRQRYSREQCTMMARYNWFQLHGHVAYCALF